MEGKICPALFDCMMRARVLACCAALVACGPPIVNILAESPLAEQGGNAKLDSVLNEINDLTRRARDDTRRMRAQAEDFFAAPRSLRGPPAAAFVSRGDAQLDAEKLSALLREFAASVGDQSGTKLAEADMEVPESETEIRKLLLEAAKNFADASASRVERKASESTSFIQPVDAARLRQSLRATEPMRAPPPMVVNVVMAEDVRGMQREAAYKAMSEESATLERNFESDLASLASS